MIEAPLGHHGLAINLDYYGEGNMRRLIWKTNSGWQIWGGTWGKHDLLGKCGEQHLEDKFGSGVAGS